MGCRQICWIPTGGFLYLMIIFKSFKKLTADRFSIKGHKLAFMYEIILNKYRMS